ncbi:MAG: hypothetical protein M5U17_04590 [Ignavibacterium sp.]|nr:hypothetical protein [Ignavibacterium sp.]
MKKKLATCNLKVKFLIIPFVLIIITITLSTIPSCSNTIAPPYENNQHWYRINEFNGMDVKGFKIIKEELYVFGSGINGGLYKTNDGINWKKIVLPSNSNFEYGVSAITVFNGDLLVAPAQSINKRLGKINASGNVNLIPIDIPIEISDIETINNTILIVPGRSYGQYQMCIIKSDSILQIIGDSLYTNPFVEDECYKQNGIRETASYKLIKKNIYDEYLLSAEAISHFIVLVDTGGYNCFTTKGLNYDDKYFGAQDLLYHNDTLFAATQQGIRYYINDFWKMYKDTLPKHNGTLQVAHSLAFIGNKIFIATTNNGVLYWNNERWEEFNKGLTVIDEKLEIYPGISYMIAFNNCLFLGYSTDKVWDYGMRGVWKFKFTN